MSNDADQPKTLGGFLDRIRHDPHEYRSVSREVDPMAFDVTAVLQRLEDRGEYPTVEFTCPRNLYGDRSEFPIVTNLWATRERCAAAVGLDESEAGPEFGVRLSEMVGRRRDPIVVADSDAPVHATVLRGEDADMYRLPVVKHAEMDLGGATTMCLAMHEPDAEFYNLSFIKAFPEQGGRAGLTIHSKDMGRMWKTWERRGEEIPVINILGAHPGFWLGTLNNTPYGDNEYATIGGFIDQPVRLTASVTWGSDFLVPADAEMIIEGTMTPGERTVVDPFGEITMLYQEQQLAPVMKVTAITHREGAVYQDVFSGHREHMLLGSIPLEGSIYNHLTTKLGIVHEVHMPYSGVGRMTAYISIHKSEDYQAKQAAIQALAHAPLIKTAVIVDDNIDVFSEEQVIWAVNTFVRPQEDVDFIQNSHSAGDVLGMGRGRMIIDATRTLSRAATTRMRIPPAALDRVDLDTWLDAPTATKGPSL